MAQGNKTPMAAFAAEKGMTPEQLQNALRSQVFKDDKATPAELFMYATRCQRYGIDPLARELLVWRSGGQIIFYLGIDAWSRIANRQPEFDGVDFEYSPEEVEASNGKKAYQWIECRIYRKDRSRPIVVREDFDEVNKGTRPWADMPKRMHRHKVFMQAARLAFGLTDLRSEDDLETESDVNDVTRMAKLTMSPDQLVEAVEKMVTLVGSGIPLEVAQGQISQLNDAQREEAQALFVKLSNKPGPDDGDTDSGEALTH